MSDASQNADRFSQCLTFSSAGEEYAIEILHVKEILPFSGATKVPMAPPAIRGLINLRGSAVPVVDLAVKFGYAGTEVSNRTCVIIMDAAVGEEFSVMGILADSVSQVIDVHADDVAPTPTFGIGVHTEHLCGVAKIGERFVPIIDIESVLSAEELCAAAVPDDRGGESGIPSTPEPTSEEPMLESEASPHESGPET